MAEMQELKRSAAKTEPNNVIPSLYSVHSDQGHFRGSLPNLNEGNKSFYPDSRYSSAIQRQSIIQNTNSLTSPSLARYSGGGIIRQRSVERRELHSSAPYSRSRSPSPNTNAQVKAQPVILSHREKYNPSSSNSNRLQLPTSSSGRQRSHSDSRLPDLRSVDILPLCPPDQITHLPISSNYTSPQFLPGSHQLGVPRKSVIINSPGTQRRHTEADIFHTESPKNPMRKVSEPAGPHIIVTFHDSDSQSESQDPLGGLTESKSEESNKQNLYESYRVRSPSHNGSPESDCGYSDHSSPGSPGVSDEQKFLDSELEDKLSEFRLNNPSEFDTLEKHLFPDTATATATANMSFNNTKNCNSPPELMVYNDIDLLLSDVVPVSIASTPYEAADYDGDEILKRLEN